jgi:hypothetical protein
MNVADLLEPFACQHLDHLGGVGIGDVDIECRR